MNTTNAQATQLPWMAASMVTLEQELTARYGEAQRPRLQKGMQQAANFWLAEDGDQAVFRDFVRTHFAGDEATLDAMFERFQYLFEQLNGHMNKVILEFRRQSDLDLGPILPFDRIFAGYNPAAHITDDLYANKLAFIVLLNFPQTTLDQRLSDGVNWTRRQWAEVRLAQGFSTRTPADVQQASSQAGAEAEQYVATYNIWMHHLLNDAGERLFQPGLRLLAHWNLRDEIKAQYSAEGPDVLEKQRMIQQVMERIITQSIPAVVVDNPHVDWNPYTNEVWPAAAQDSDLPVPADMEVSNAPEPDTRYAKILNNFQAARRADPYWPTAPTLIARRFQVNREIPEARVKEMFEQVLTSPLVGQVAELIEDRLGRPLEPFDVWYNGFRATGTRTESDLDAIVARKYPTPQAYEKDIPNLLRKLGFARPRAKVIADNIVVDPARGAGHAWGAEMRSEKAHLRTRVGAGGMDYKGYNIAIHEMGHNVEQTISLNEIDYTLLRGVPNTAFTEAMAFVFQGRDLELLGLAKGDAQREIMTTLDDFWGTFEIAGVALVDIEIWHWMYAHPEATPAELRAAMIAIAKDIWNRYYASVFNQEDVILLGVYQHIVMRNMYIPDYPLGHIIARQIEEQIKQAGKLGPEFERMVKAGNIAPDLWMKNATGSPVGPEALLHATGRALGSLQE
ncbi:MAG: hypothetical protein KAU50_12580 [Candidatus Marinimicrobia bacterium]|nr:hypothetical protein [Candidatus Neomarinimicrobiota bacterium]